MKTNKQTPQYQWIRIGSAAVDSGCLMICDPCYAIGKDADLTQTYPDWSDFVDNHFKWDDKHNQYTFHQVPFKLGHEGAGVVASTAYGDGFYPVYALVDKSDPDTEKPLGMMVLTGDIENHPLPTTTN